MSKLELESQESCVLGAVLRRQAEEIPDAIHLMAGDDHYSYGRFNELANSHAAGLRELGVEAGDTVALFMGSSPECVFTTFGANKLGAIWVPTNTDYRGEWLRGKLRTAPGSPARQGSQPRGARDLRQRERSLLLRAALHRVRR